eukprot:3646748-Amphidinium_carterae.1
MPCPAEGGVHTHTHTHTHRATTHVPTPMQVRTRTRTVPCTQAWRHGDRLSRCDYAVFRPSPKADSKNKDRPDNRTTRNQTFLSL